jgi:hypothetical protein
MGGDALRYRLAVGLLPAFDASLTRKGRSFQIGCSRAAHLFVCVKIVDKTLASTRTHLTPTTRDATEGNPIALLGSSQTRRGFPIVVLHLSE